MSTEIRLPAKKELTKKQQLAEDRRINSILSNIKDQAGPWYHWVEVTPELAQIWLDRNIHNRPIRALHVENNTRYMMNGEWTRTGEPIKFYGSYQDPKAVLMDGQHRLQAIIEYGKPVMIEVVDNLPSDAFQYMDQGKTRSASDILKIEGYKNTLVLAAMTRYLILYEQGGPKSVWQSSQWSKLRVSNHEILYFVRSNEKRLLSAIKEVQKHIYRISRNYGVLSACNYLFKRRGVMDSINFFYALGTGEYDEIQKKFPNTKTSPIHHLRNILIDHQTTQNRGFRTGELFIMTIKAWNLYRDGTECMKKDIYKFEIDTPTFPKGIR